MSRRRSGVCRCIVLSVCAALCLSARASVAAEEEAAPAALSSAEAYTWQNVVIVGGGFVTGIVTHPTAPGVMYARTDIGGAYRWDPGPERWIPLLDWVPAADWNLFGVESIALDPTDPARVYMACGTYTNERTPNGAVLRSTDQGRTWERTDMPIKFGGNEAGRGNGERLAVDPNEPSILLLGTRNDGLWRSADHGASWQRVESFPISDTREPEPEPEAGAEQQPWRRFWRPTSVGIVFVIFDGASGEAGKPTPTIYAGASWKPAALYRSTDAGATWAPVEGQPTGMVPHHAALTPAGVLYVTYGNGPGPNDVTDGAVWKLDTKTATWTDVTPLRPGGEDVFGYAGLSVDAAHPETVMVTTLDRWHAGDEVFRSTNGGAAWAGLMPAAVADLSVAPWLNSRRREMRLGHWMGDLEIDPHDSGHVMYTSGDGIYRSKDVTEADAGRPTHWQVGACGLEETVVNGLISPPAGAHLLSVMWDLGGFRHTDLDVSPPEGQYEPSHGSNRSIDFAGQRPDVIVRGYDNGACYSLDGGRTWTDSPTQPEAPPAPEGAPRRWGMRGGPGAVSADGGTFAWSVTGGQYCSRDLGQTWTACEGIEGTAAVVSDRVDPLRFYAYDGQAGALLASTDGAASFAPVAEGLPQGWANLRAVPGKEGHLWLAAESGLYRSTEGGAGFARLDGVESAARVGFGKEADGRDYPAVYLVGTVGGVYGIFRSDDEGGSWVRINDDAHQYGGINAVTGDPRVYGRVYVASSHRGILYGEPAGAQ